MHSAGGSWPTFSGHAPGAASDADALPVRGRAGDPGRAGLAPIDFTEFGGPSGGRRAVGYDKLIEGEAVLLLTVHDFVFGNERLPVLRGCSANIMAGCQLFAKRMFRNMG